MIRYLLTALGIGGLLVVVGLVAAADPAREQAIQKDRQLYEGVWRVVSLEVDGEKEPDRAARMIAVTNHRDGSWVLRVDGREAARGTSRIDPTRKPRTIGFTPDGEGGGPTLLGIYEISGDTRKLCFASAGKGRPTEFSAEAGSGRVLAVFRREKK
jgi:uncharacterized protein (TIGR03067 family)